MIARFKNYINKQSVIQSTLIKITITIFGFLIILLFLYGKNYWEKEEFRSNYELLSALTSAQSNLQFKVIEIETIKKDHTFSKEQIAEKITSLLHKAKSVPLDTNIIIGYYDLDLDSVFIENDVYLTVFELIRPKLGSVNEFQELSWNSNRLISINLPIYDHQKLVGYVWAYSKYNISFFKSYQKMSVIIILALSLSVLIVILIRKNIREVELHLDSFSKSITDDNYDHDQILTRLPELHPVLHKIIDFTDELKHMNLELEASRLKITKILEGISDGFFALDRGHRFTFINSETAKLISRADTKLMVLGKSLFDVFPQVDSITHAKIEEALAKNESMHWEAEGFTNSEQYYEYHAYPFKEGLTVFFRDITDVRRQRQELAHMERLNLIGQLAAGISHEIRNPLTTVRGFLQFLATKPKYTHEKEYMDLMISEIDRANLIITDFLSLSKENLDNIKPRNINEIINKVYPLLQADAYNSNKQVFLSLGILPNIMLNENEIKQLVLNLVRNGLEATPENGSVFISTYQKGDRITLAIKDQGPGIPPEIQGRIGTPFFTTKETGTGLGLAISIGIARRHKAEFDFETGCNGTTFYISFKDESAITYTQ